MDQALRKSDFLASKLALIKVNTLTTLTFTKIVGEFPNFEPKFETEQPRIPACDLSSDLDITNSKYKIHFYTVLWRCCVFIHYTIIYCFHRKVEIII